MSEDKFNLFQQEYPNLFKEYPRSGFDLSPGWTMLVQILCSIIEIEINRLPEEVRADVQCAQCKQKFGSLRFYMTSETPYISGAIAVAETMSAFICEECGMPGKQRSGGWVETLCDEHYVERESKKRIT